MRHVLGTACILGVSPGDSLSPSCAVPGVQAC